MSRFFNDPSPDEDLQIEDDEELVIHDWNYQSVFENIRDYQNLRSVKFSEFSQDLDSFLDLLPKNLEKIEISFYFMPTFLDDLLSFTDLKSLTIIYGDLAELPSNLSNLQNLRILDLSENSLENANIILESLPNLTYLNLQNNKISYFNPGDIVMPNLRYLALGKGLEMIPLLTRDNFPQLEVFDLTNFNRNMIFDQEYNYLKEMRASGIKVTLSPDFKPLVKNKLTEENIDNYISKHDFDKLQMLQTQLCQSYENNFNVPELKKMATSLGLPVKVKNTKKDLCADIGAYILKRKFEKGELPNLKTTRRLKRRVRKKK